MDKPLWMWVVFFGIIFFLLLLDLGLIHKKQKVISFKQSLYMSLAYVSLGLLFGVWVGYELGTQAFAEYLTAFLVEKSLSLDNIFVISVIFSSLAIPSQYQHRVLFLGILGVIVLRAIMIGVGAQLIHHLSGVLYVFSLLLLITGIKMFFVRDNQDNAAHIPALNWMRKHINLTQELHGQQFFVRKYDPLTQKKRIFGTPLLLALIAVELADVIFAVDSIPAVFTITQNIYIVYTSNLFAILGLRSLYFVLATMIRRFYYLKMALAAILVFIGAKIFIADLLGWEKFPPMVSLLLTIGLLSTGIIASIFRSSKTSQRLMP